MKTSESKFCQCLYFASGALARKVEKIAIETWKEVDLVPSHAYLLLLIIEMPGCQPGCLAAQLQLSPSTITRFIEKLEEKKLVVRITEGKITNVYATPKGNAMLTQLKSCINAFYQKYAGILGTQESTNLVKQINAMADRL